MEEASVLYYYPNESFLKSSTKGAVSYCPPPGYATDMGGRWGRSITMGGRQEVDAAAIP